MRAITYVYDNGGVTLDRYIILFDWAKQPGGGRTRFRECLSVSPDPSHPQGVSQWGIAEAGDHLGKLIDYQDLPLNVRTHIAQRLA